MHFIQARQKNCCGALQESRIFAFYGHFAAETVSFSSLRTISLPRDALISLQSGQLQASRYNRRVNKIIPRTRGSFMENSGERMPEREF